MAKIEYWVWLSSLSSVSIKSKAALIEHYGDPQRAFAAPKGDFFTVPGLSKKDAEEIEKRDVSAVRRIMATCKEQEVNIIPFSDQRYPDRLRNIFAPPVVLYVKGTLPDVDTSAAIALVGTRNASSYGLKMSRKLAGEIVSCGGIVVSGLTKGIDAEAAWGALDAGGVCVGVLGVPHELETGELTARTAENGAVISEYPPGTKPNKYFFRERNRITSGLSVGAVAVEAPTVSGTRLFIAEAAEQGRELFAVPGNADSENSEGTNGFIKDGAKPVTCGWDVLCEFERRFPVRNNPCHIPPKAEKPAPRTEKAVDRKRNTGYIEAPVKASKPIPEQELPPDQKKIMAAIRVPFTTVDDITAETALPASRVLAQLTVLEIKGLVRRLPGQRVCKTE